MMRLPRCGACWDLSVSNAGAGVGKSAGVPWKSAHSTIADSSMWRINLWLAGAAFAVLLTTISLQPWRPKAFLRGTIWHWPLHAMAFGAVALFPLLLSRNRRQELVRAILVVGLALAVEYVQGRIYRHPTEWRDVQANGAGVLLAYGLVRGGRMVYERGEE
jgi:hypothetical protein